MEAALLQHPFSSEEIFPELSFIEEENQLIIEGNPFVNEDWDEYNRLLNQARQHLVHGKNLNVFIKLTGLNEAGRLFLLKLGQMLNRFNSRRPMVTWSPLSNTSGLNEGLKLLNLPSRQLRVV